jgi:hypothetical protein
MILTKSIVSTLILDLFLMAGYNEAMKEELDISTILEVLLEDCNGNKVASDSTMQEIKLVLEPKLKK